MEVCFVCRTALSGPFSRRVMVVGTMDNWAQHFIMRAPVSLCRACDDAQAEQDAPGLVRRLLGLLLWAYLTVCVCTFTVLAWQHERWAWCGLGLGGLGWMLQRVRVRHARGGAVK